MFPTIKKYLTIGFENSAWLRYQSEFYEGNLEKHDRNPFVNVDELVKRLIGEDICWKWIGLNKIFPFGDLNISVSEKGEIKVTNIGRNAIILPEEFSSKNIL